MPQGRFSLADIDQPSGGTGRFSLDEIEPGALRPAPIMVDQLGRIGADAKYSKTSPSRARAHVRAR